MVWWRSISLAGCWMLGMCMTVSAMDITVTSAQISKFKGVEYGQRVDGLIWRGGLQMQSTSEKFGGLSGITFTGTNFQFAMVSDIGNFVSGKLFYDAKGAPVELVGVHVDAIQNSSGQELPRAFAKDAEAVEVIYREGIPSAVRVGFENLTRVADFDITNGRPGGAAREVSIPSWLTNLRTNKSLEAVCIAPAASPISGSTLLITEGKEAGNGDFAAFMLGKKDRGEFTFVKSPGLNPTDCAFLPNGDLLVLERGTGFLSFVMQLKRINGGDVRPGAALRGEVILSASGGEIDNMEGLAVHDGPDGMPRITIISDDNFNDWERSLLFEFSLPTK